MAKKRIKKILRKVEKKEKKVELFPEKLYNIILQFYYLSIFYKNIIKNYLFHS